MAPSECRLSGDKRVAQDLQVVQTATALERLAVATYDFTLGLPFIGGTAANPVVERFATTTMQQHAEHARAFNAALRNLGSKDEGQPDPELLQSVEAAKQEATDPQRAVELVLMVEQALTESYVAALATLADPVAKSTMSAIMGVESQHAAVLRLFKVLLVGDGAALIALPPDVAKLPAAAGSAGFPDTFVGTSRKAARGNGTGN